MTDSAARSDPFGITITPRGMQRRASRGHHAVRETMLLLHRTYHLVRLELRQTSFGLYLGNLWLLLEPALQAGAYYFLLKVVFGAQGADATFAFFFVGITFWRSHATLLAGAPYFLTTKGHTYVEQGLGINIAITELVANEIVLLMMRLAVLAFFLVVTGYSPTWMWPLVLVVVIVQLTFTMGLQILLAMFGVIFKDSAKIVGHVVWLWWYMSPGLYSIRRIPAWAEVIYNLNPFATLMPAYHWLLLRTPNSHLDVTALVIVFAFSLALLWLALLGLRRFSYSMMQHI